MQKIPTLFERDWKGDPSRVVDVVNPLCQWVADGEGVARRKYDGMCCMVRESKLFKRRELKAGQKAPAGFELIGHDDVTKKTVGWVPVNFMSAEDQYFLEAWGTKPYREWEDGTYELLGPKVQGNPESMGSHILIRHDSETDAYGDHDAPRTYDGLRDWLGYHDIEGLVFHHEDGRRAKIKRKDFGLKRYNPLQPFPDESV